VQIKNEYGDLSMAIIERYGGPDTAKVLTVVPICIRHWKVHNRKGLEPLLEAPREGELRSSRSRRRAWEGWRGRATLRNGRTEGVEAYHGHEIALLRYAPRRA
jgi:hypothetical protein